MRDNKHSPDDTSTASYREERDDSGAAGSKEPAAPGVILAASIRGAVGREGAPNEDSGSPGSEADRAAAEARSEDDSQPEAD